MLKGIAPVISPELLKVLSEMGHGDEIVFGDGNFPAEALGRRVVRADGLTITSLLDAVISLFPLDYVTEYSAILSQYREKEPAVWSGYRQILSRDAEGGKPFLVIPKPEFYERAAKAYCIVATTEKEAFANIIIRKGVVKI